MKNKENQKIYHLLFIISLGILLVLSPPYFMVEHRAIIIGAIILFYIPFLICSVIINTNIKVKEQFVYVILGVLSILLAIVNIVMIVLIFATGFYEYYYEAAIIMATIIHVLLSISFIVFVAINFIQYATLKKEAKQKLKGKINLIKELSDLKKLLDNGVISEEEFNTQKEIYLNDLK